jgi:hypothetical protein
MVETCLPVDESDNSDFANYSSGLCVSSNNNLSSSVSSLTLGSPNDKEIKSSDYHFNVNSGSSATLEQHSAPIRKPRSFIYKDTNNGVKTNR